MFADKPWLQVVAFLVVAVPVVAILTRVITWLVYCFKAAPNRSGAEEMQLADWESKLAEGVKPYSSYEEWRQDVRSNKPLDEILGRVPPGFFDKKPEPAGAQGAQGAVGPACIVGSPGPQGAQAGQVARQRLAEIQARIKSETNQASRRHLEQFRQHLIAPSATPPVGESPWFPNFATKKYCQNCNGTGYVTRPNIDGIPTAGIPCAWCKK